MVAGAGRIAVIIGITNIGICNIVMLYNSSKKNKK